MASSIYGALFSSAVSTVFGVARRAGSKLFVRRCRTVGMDAVTSVGHCITEGLSTARSISQEVSKAR